MFDLQDKPEQDYMEDTSSGLNKLRGILVSSAKVFIFYITRLFYSVAYNTEKYFMSQYCIDNHIGRDAEDFELNTFFNTILTSTIFFILYVTL